MGCGGGGFEQEDDTCIQGIGLETSREPSAGTKAAANTTCPPRAPPVQRSVSGEPGASVERAVGVCSAKSGSLAQRLSSTSPGQSNMGPAPAGSEEEEAEEANEEASASSPTHEAVERHQAWSIRSTHASQVSGKVASRKEEEVMSMSSDEEEARLAVGVGSGSAWRAARKAPSAPPRWLMSSERQTSHMVQRKKVRGMTAAEAAQGRPTSRPSVT